MQLKIPKNTKEVFWTKHSLFKMQYYALSVQKILHVIKKPERKEDGIVKNTIAVMQPISLKIQNGRKIWKQEIWVMYQTKVQSSKCKVQSRICDNLTPTLSLPCRQAGLKRRGGIKIISAWRYPGVSPKKNPIPDDILEEIKDAI